MKFVLSYSGGKDSVLAMKRAMDLGHEPLVLLTTVPPGEDESHFHRLPLELLDQAARSLGVPLEVLRTQGEAYAGDFEGALRRWKEHGAELVVFGDIDLEEHLTWCTARCEAAGLTPLFPHWGKPRDQVAREFISDGFVSLITVINTDKMDQRHLGREFTADVVAELEQAGVDVCGEGGEFHTFVVDGPHFSRRIRPRIRGIDQAGPYRWLKLDPTEAGDAPVPEVSYRFFRNEACAYFPCHQGMAPERFNCLFCFCPLYLLGPGCGGNYRYVGDQGTIKDCSACTLPHQPAYYDVILERLRQASERAGNGRED